MASSDTARILAQVVAAGAARGLGARDQTAALGLAFERSGVIDRLPPVPLFVEFTDEAVALSGELMSAAAELSRSGSEPAWLVGQLYEAAMGRSAKRRSGAFFTPAAAAHGFVALACRSWARPPADLMVCDPAIGGGAFALAAATMLEAAGRDRASIVEQHIWGIDLDPDAVEVARAALALWAGVDGDAKMADPADHLLVADGLSVESMGLHGGGFDLVIGNPPFKNQLGAATARDGGERQALIDRFGSAAKGYTDTAALFLLAGHQLAHPDGGRVAMVQPVSTLVAAHAQEIRNRLVTDADLVGLWLGGRRVFAASAAVSVCGIVIERTAAAGAVRTVERATGPEVAIAPPLEIGRDDLVSAGTWADSVADLRGLPPLVMQHDGTLGDWARATAGFRDQFYGLVPYVSDPGSDDQPRLITTGLIDALVCHWGRSPTRLAGRALSAPRIDVDRLAVDDPTLAKWVRQRLGPKVLVATQSRVIEAIVDEEGNDVPSVPVVSVELDPDRLWDAVAVLTAPPISLWALRHHGGAALSEDTIKLSARQLLSVPLPVDRSSWTDGAVAARRAWAAPDAGPDRVVRWSAEAIGRWDEAMWACGLAMCAAYRIEDSEGLTEWWFQRLPRRFEKSFRKMP